MAFYKLFKVRHHRTDYSEFFHQLRLEFIKRNCPEKYNEYMNKKAKINNYLNRLIGMRNLVHDIYDNF